MLTARSCGSPALTIHVEETGLVEVGVGREELLGRAGGRLETGSHLGMPGGAKVPVVRGFGPSSVGLNSLRAVVLGVGNGVGQEFGSRASGVVTEDGEGTESETSVADAVPVSVGRLPPSVAVWIVKGGQLKREEKRWSASDGRQLRTDRLACDSPRALSVRVQAKAETEVDYGPHDGVALVCRPGIVHPVVRVGEGEGELSDVEEVLDGRDNRDFSFALRPASQMFVVLAAPSTQQTHLWVPSSSVSTEGLGRVTRGDEEFLPGPVDPGRVVGHAVGVGPVLDAELEDTCDVEHARPAQATVDVVGDGVHVCKPGSVGKDGLVPRAEVRVLGDLGRQAVPFRLRCEQAWVVRTDVDAASADGVVGVVGGTETCKAGRGSSWCRRGRGRGGRVDWVAVGCGGVCGGAWMVSEWQGKVTRAEEGKDATAGGRRLVSDDVPPSKHCFSYLGIRDVCDKFRTKHATVLSPLLELGRSSPRALENWSGREGRGRGEGTVGRGASSQRRTGSREREGEVGGWTNEQTNSQSLLAAAVLSAALLLMPLLDFELLSSLLLLFDPSMPPTTAPTMTARRTAGTPNLTHFD